MAYCNEHTIVKGNADVQVAVSLKCRAWTCPNCFDTRKKQLIAEAAGGRPTTFLTLTTRRSDKIDPDRAAMRLSKAWRLCRLRIIRFYGLSELPFLAVVEATKAGWPHLHILMRAPYIDWEMISEWMWELCDGAQINIQRIDKHRKMTAYVAKYCGKCSHRYKHTKRYWQSQDYDLREDEDPRQKPLPGDGWEIWNKHIRTLADGWHQVGWHVEWLSVHKFVASRDPPESAVP